MDAALRNKKLFLLDMDGTIYLDEELFDGTKELLSYINTSGGRYLFLTNNSSKGIDKYMEKLARMGITAGREDFLTSVDATIRALLLKKYKMIYVFGTQSFFSQLREAGLPVTMRLQDDIDCLCIAYDTELTYQKLEDACILLGRKIDYIATNPDWVCPTSYGFVPDCGSVCEMLFRATKRRPLVIGKPQPAMALLALQRTGFRAEEAVLLGDRVYTDIACGVNAGIDTVFVLSGEGTRQDLEHSEVRPTYIFENVRELYEALVR